MKGIYSLGVMQHTELLKLKSEQLKTITVIRINYLINYNFRREVDFISAPACSWNPPVKNFRGPGNTKQESQWVNVGNIEQFSVTSERSVDWWTSKFVSGSFNSGCYNAMGVFLIHPVIQLRKLLQTTNFLITN